MIFDDLHWGEFTLSSSTQNREKKKSSYFCQVQESGSGTKNVGDRVLILRTGETRVDTIKFVCVCCENP